MSHVSALPAPSHGFDETAVEAAQLALQAVSDNFYNTDVMDVTVTLVGAAAVARIVYEAAKHPSTLSALTRLVHLFRKVKS